MFAVELMRESFNESKKKQQKTTFLATIRVQAYATLAWEQAAHWAKGEKNWRGRERGKAGKRRW